MANPSMVGTERTPRSPHPDRLQIRFDRAAIVALGKITYYGSNTVRFLVRLSDGREAFVKGYLQPKDDQKWLRKISRKMGGIGSPPRGGLLEKWAEVS